MQSYFWFVYALETKKIQDAYDMFYIQLLLGLPVCLFECNQLL